MQTKEFHGKQISRLGMGGLRFPHVPGKPNEIDRKQGQIIIDRAIQAGINYFDTAYTYQNGDSERFLGEALSKYPRDSYYLATKFYVAASEDIEAVFEEQLKRCQTDYFDFYLFHCLDETTIDAYMDPKKDYLGFLKKQKELGRIRHIGFSSHAAPKTLERFLNWNDEFDMALIQLNYVDWTLLDARRQYELLTEHNIPVWVMEPLKGGRLSTLNKTAEHIMRWGYPERAPSEWGFRFLLSLPNVQTVLSGMSDPEQLRENVVTFSDGTGLSAEERKILQQAKEAFLKDLGVPCSACRYCCDTCPAHLDIPLLIRGYNEKHVSGETWRVDGLESTLSADHCIGCGTCLRHCPQKINIPQIMKELTKEVK